MHTTHRPHIFGLAGANRYPCRNAAYATLGSDRTCPVHALEQWLHFARIDFGPVFVGTSRD